MSEPPGFFPGSDWHPLHLETNSDRAGGPRSVPATVPSRREFVGFDQEQAVYNAAFFDFEGTTGYYGTVNISVTSDDPSSSYTMLGATPDPTAYTTYSPGVTGGVVTLTITNLDDVGINFAQNFLTGGRNGVDVPDYCSYLTKELKGTA